MIIVNTHQAKTRLSSLLVQIEEHHETVRVCRNGKPIADIVPIQKTVIDPLRQHAILQGVEILYNPTDPLSEDEWPSD
ncbi:MAG: type II toxin-antitoxin system Phd/YefM family antitoxin [Gammaproteobacteria bacterium]